MSSVGYWYADGPSAAVPVPPAAARMPVLRTSTGVWLTDPKGQLAAQKVQPNAEMLEMKRRWAGEAEALLRSPARRARPSCRSRQGG